MRNCVLYETFLQIKVISMKDVKLELDEIELQQQGLEKQGVRLEQLIRDKCESESRIEGNAYRTKLGLFVISIIITTTTIMIHLLDRFIARCRCGGTSFRIVCTSEREKRIIQEAG